MAAQGERVSRAIGIEIDVMLDPMAQDSPEQDIVMGELELPPQMDPEPEMGAAAAAVCDAPPSPPPSKSLPNPRRTHA